MSIFLAQLTGVILAGAAVTALLLHLLDRRRYARLTDLVPGLEQPDEEPEVTDNEALIERWLRDGIDSSTEFPAALHIVDGVYCLDHCSPKAGYRLAVLRRNMTVPQCRACLIQSLTK